MGEALSTVPPALDPKLAGRWIRPPAEAAEALARLVEQIRAGEVRDLRGARLAGAHLSGVDLSGCDLRGADLSRANLRGAKLVEADLSSAELHEAILEEAELAGAKLLGASLEGVRARRAGFGRADLRHANFFGADLTEASFVEARLRRADMRTASMHGARLTKADLSMADFAHADLEDADLGCASVVRASFVEADLRRARLRCLSGFEKASFLRADIRDVDFSGAYLLRRHIIDENYLDEFRKRSGLHRAAYWAWWVSSDCGRSLLRWTLWTFALALLFGAAFHFVTMDYQGHETWIAPFYYSVVTLTTLGYGDVVPGSAAAQGLAMAEVTIGYLMLGGLISIFSNKLARRGE